MKWSSIGSQQSTINGFGCLILSCLISTHVCDVVEPVKSKSAIAADLLTQEKNPVISVASN